MPQRTDDAAAGSQTDAAGAWPVALAGIVALAVAMGIGRFAFTPLLPMMLDDGVVDLAESSLLASANYLGYMLGAALCTLQPWIWRRLGRTVALDATAMVRFGMAATALVTMGMAPHLPAFWPLLRFAAGVASALVFVYISSWSLNRFAEMRVTEMGALIYVGPGAGIVVSGLAASAMVGLDGKAATGWLVFGLLAAALTAMVWPVLRRGGSRKTGAPPAAAPTDLPAQPGAGRFEMALLAFAYGLAGLGYIISATFLPVIARQAIPDSAWLDLFWPIFGAGIVIGALVASRMRAGTDLRWRLIACYLLQASGIGLGLLLPSSAGFALGSLLLGLPMTAITYFAMQEVRRLAPKQAASRMGLLTAVYGLGQVAGPPLAAIFLAHSVSVDAGFTQALVVAAAALVIGAAAYAAMLRVYPLTRP